MTDAPRSTPPQDGLPDRMRIRFWGVRGSIPTPGEANAGIGGNTACVGVTLPDGTECILDLGTGARALGAHLIRAHQAEDQKAPLDLHVFLSHFHWDHIQGMPFFAPLYGPGNRITFYASEKEGAVDALLEAQMQAPFFPVSFDMLAAERRYIPLFRGEPVQIGALTVRPFAVHHTQHVFGFRLDAHGASFVYCTDYEHGEAAHDAVLREAIRGVDLFVCDAQYTPEEYATRKGWGHSTWVDATRLAAEAGVGMLALFHHDPAHDDARLLDILSAAQTAFPDTVLAQEGLVLDL